MTSSFASGQNILVTKACQAMYDVLYDVQNKMVEIIIYLVRCRYDYLIIFNTLIISLYGIKIWALGGIVIHVYLLLREYIWNVANFDRTWRNWTWFINILHQFFQIYFAYDKVPESYQVIHPHIITTTLGFHSAIYIQGDVLQICQHWFLDQLSKSVQHPSVRPSVHVS